MAITFPGVNSVESLSREEVYELYPDAVAEAGIWVTGEPDFFFGLDDTGALWYWCSIGPAQLHHWTGGKWHWTLPSW